MASLLVEAFGTSDLDLYEDVLNVPKDCSPSQLRKAYYNQARQLHPDKNDCKEAKLKFQAISWAYSLLKDKRNREEYDRDGEIPYEDDDSDDEGQSKKSWKEYFDLIFGKLSTDDIDSFAEKYKMSKEEEKDVLKYYAECKGNLNKMLGYVMLSEERDVTRWIEDYIQPAIDENEVDNFEKALRKTRDQIEKKISKELKESKIRNSADDIDDSGEETEIEDEIKSSSKLSSSTKGKNIKKKTVAHKAKSTKKSLKKKKNAEEDLIAAIRNKNGRGNPLASIASRYGVSLVDSDPINDADFEKLR
jgi:curved DNA-binding protein CbpA